MRRGRVIGGLFVLALLILVAVRGVPAVVRAHRFVRAQTAADLPERLLALAVQGLPPERGEWGQAMLAELAGVRGSQARWRFSAGCSRAAAALRLRASVAAPDRGGAAVRALVLGALAITVALAGYGLVHYPGLRSGPGVWLSFAAFLAIVLAYAWTALALSRGSTPEARAARAYGLAAGIVIGAAWLMLLAPAEFSKSLVALPLAVALLGPVCVALLAGRASGSAGTATAAAVWSGLVGGLLVFIVWVAATYNDDGRPYDAQMLRDFHRSGSHDLVAYAVSDNLGAALGLLVIIPVVALALGSLSGRLAAARSPATRPARPRR